VVVSNKMDKTIVVQVTRRIRHPVYGKEMSQSRKFHAHDEKQRGQGRRHGAHRGIPPPEPPEALAPGGSRGSGPTRPRKESHMITMKTLLDPADNTGADPSSAFTCAGPAASASRASGTSSRSRSRTPFRPGWSRRAKCTTRWSCARSRHPPAGRLAAALRPQCGGDCG
jgi:hypothetical protein